MSYVEKTLSKDEEIKEIVKLHWFNYLFTSVLALIALFFGASYFMSTDLQRSSGSKVFAIFFGVWALYNFLKLYMTEMVITRELYAEKALLV